MPGLKLREEFLGMHMPGTAISLHTSDNQGAAQKSPDCILPITYPTADVQTALKAISKKRSGRGKSRIMAVMRHSIQSPDIVEHWLDIDEADKPSKGDRPVPLVIPVQIEGDNGGQDVAEPDETGEINGNTPHRRGLS
jgi:hypothetical protein